MQVGQPLRLANLHLAPRTLRRRRGAKRATKPGNFSHESDGRAGVAPAPSQRDAGSTLDRFMGARQVRLEKEAPHDPQLVGSPGFSRLRASQPAKAGTPNHLSDGFLAAIQVRFLELFPAHIPQRRNSAFRGCRCRSQEIPRSGIPRCDQEPIRSGTGFQPVRFETHRQDACAARFVPA